jgi:hypothetical protein
MRAGPEKTPFTLATRRQWLRTSVGGLVAPYLREMAGHRQPWPWMVIALFEVAPATMFRAVAQAG